VERLVIFVVLSVILLLFVSLSRIFSEHPYISGLFLVFLCGESHDGMI
jgi:hypothetical protein